ncbi:hypothetical protein GCM10020295_78550 [Streptomyces cinereospinus]
MHPERGGWEEVPYWLRGYVPLAVATRDRTALARSRQWIDAILATQQSDGFFGPRALRTSLNAGPDFWPFLPLLQALRTHEEFTGDPRVVPFLIRFLRFMNAQGPGAFDSSWISYRWGTDSTSRYGCTVVPGRRSCSTWPPRCTPWARTGRDPPPRGTTSTSPRASANPPSTRRSPAPRS